MTEQTRERQHAGALVGCSHRECESAGSQRVTDFVVADVVERRF